MNRFVTAFLQFIFQQIMPTQKTRIKQTVFQILKLIRLLLII